MISFSKVKKNPYILEFIRQTDIALTAIGHTDHGQRHAHLVADRARNVAKEIGLTKKEQELSAIAGFCHDIGNFLSRSGHHLWAALLFSQIFHQQFSPVELTILLQAIANHDRQEMEFTNAVSAVTVLADKSDVHRSRVREKDLKKIKADLHDRVNYAVQESKLKIDKKNKEIKLTLQVDTEFCPLIEYFEIFTQRMIYCRKAAEFLGYRFGLEINKFKLL
ncbi:MAG: HD domain-containing protein [Patescibacteria group bacterium]|nr:HD domain-containing protein [Patescibacteria group bacterium]